MGYASYAEDIDKLREHWTNLDEGVSKIRTFVTNTKISDPNRVEAELRKFVLRIDEMLKDVQGRTKLVFEKAEVILRDPHVQIVKRLDKKAAEVDKLRQKLDGTLSELSLSRERNKKLQKKFDELCTNSKIQEKQICALEETRLWAEQAKSVRLMHRK